MKYKSNWVKLLEYGVAIAATLVLISCAIGLMTVVGIGVIIEKILLFIK